jgi:hypothetical protein
LQRCDAHLLAHGDGADGRGFPFVHRPKQAAGFAGQLGARARAKAEVANVLVKALLADLHRQLDGSHVAGVLQRLMDRDAAEVFALVVVNGAAGDGNLAALAVDHVVGRGGMLVQRGRVGDQLEDRARLVDIADGVVAEQLWRGVAEEVWVEGWADGQRQNLAGMHVLDDHRGVSRLGTFHRVIQRPFGHELNVLVDGEGQVPARLWLAFRGAEHMATRIHGRIHAAGNPVQ